MVNNNQDINSEIKITPEMIKAGADYLEGQVFPYGACGDAAEELAKDVFEVMLRVRENA